MEKVNEMDCSFTCHNYGLCDCCTVAGAEGEHTSYNFNPHSEPLRCIEANMAHVEPRCIDPLGAGCDCVLFPCRFVDVCAS